MLERPYDLIRDREGMVARQVVMSRAVLPIIKFAPWRPRPFGLGRERRSPSRASAYP